MRGPERRHRALLSVHLKPARLDGGKPRNLQSPIKQEGLSKTAPTSPSLIVAAGLYRRLEPPLRALGCAPVLAAGAGKRVARLTRR